MWPATNCFNPYQGLHFIFAKFEKYLTIGVDRLMILSLNEYVVLKMVFCY